MSHATLVEALNRIRLRLREISGDYSEAAETERDRLVRQAFRLLAQLSGPTIH